MTTNRGLRPISKPRKDLVPGNNPTPSKPPTPVGDQATRNKAVNRKPLSKVSCYVAVDHSEYSDEENALIDYEAQVPGTSFKTPVKVCVYHKLQIDALRKDEMAAIKAMAMAPYGKCHVCDYPVGVRENDTPPEEKAGQGYPVNYWEHMNDPDDVCHENCRCTATVGVEEGTDKEVKGIGERVGRRRRVVLV